jgi:hypothetical protein
MTEERLVLADLLEKAGDGDFLRTVAEAVLQLLMESDVARLLCTSLRTTDFHSALVIAAERPIGSLAGTSPAVAVAGNERRL